jgi:hypothetical protein
MKLSDLSDYDAPAFADLTPSASASQSARLKGKEGISTRRVPLVKAGTESINAGLYMKADAGSDPEAHPLPIQLIPSDVLTDIFLICEKEAAYRWSTQMKLRTSADSPPIPHYMTIDNGPWNFAHVCRFWRQVVRSCPLLWASISIWDTGVKVRSSKMEHIGEEGCTTRLSRGMEYSGSLVPLDIICNSQKFMARFSSMISDYSARFGSLGLWGDIRNGKRLSSCFPLRGEYLVLNHLDLFQNASDTEDNRYSYGEDGGGNLAIFTITPPNLRSVSFCLSKFKHIQLPWFQIEIIQCFWYSKDDAAVFLDCLSAMLKDSTNLRSLRIGVQQHRLNSFQNSTNYSRRITGSDTIISLSIDCVDVLKYIKLPNLRELTVHIVDGINDRRRTDFPPCEQFLTLGEFLAASASWPTQACRISKLDIALAFESKDSAELCRFGDFRRCISSGGAERWIKELRIRVDWRFGGDFVKAVVDALTLYDDDDELEQAWLPRLDGLTIEISSSPGPYVHDIVSAITGPIFWMLRSRSDSSCLGSTTAFLQKFRFLVDRDAVQKSSFEELVEILKEKLRVLSEVRETYRELKESSMDLFFFVGWSYSYLCLFVSN